mmetsp:Transcript_27386/g.79891  ORF Transcript_27386/g.79891 Transcript_27386/m.79891 type:complete len:223 (+) Transcript_27386:1773-2441(+)
MKSINAVSGLGDAFPGSSLKTPILPAEHQFVARYSGSPLLDLRRLEVHLPDELFGDRPHGVDDALAGALHGRFQYHGVPQRVREIFDAPAATAVTGASAPSDMGPNRTEPFVHIESLSHTEEAKPERAIPWNLLEAPLHDAERRKGLLSLFLQPYGFVIDGTIPGDMSHEILEDFARSIDLPRAGLEQRSFEHGPPDLVNGRVLQACEKYSRFSEPTVLVHG